jgi:hypothetical protein
MLHDVADAAAQAAETMGAAKARFTEHYELPREFAGNGGLMTHDGRWITGEGARPQKDTGKCPRLGFPSRRGPYP